MVEIDYRNESPDAVKAMYALERFIRQSGIERRLVELIKIRVSQINKCGFCLDMHTKDARALGEDEQRIYLLDAFMESPCYNEKEKSALELAESLALVHERGVPGEIAKRCLEHFSPEEYIVLIMIVNTISAWNRICIATSTPVGTYQPKEITD